MSGIFLVMLGALAVAQTDVPVGVIELKVTTVKSGGKPGLARKRFYILPGGLADNRVLLDRIKAAEISSRDCFYSRAQASTELICWLASENCESPYCRKIEQADVDKVPEFQTAYQKGLKKFPAKPDLARLWLTTELSPVFVSGYNDDRQAVLEKILSGVKPIRSTMTDGKGFSTTFVDLPLAGAKSVKFTVSNIIPIEVGGKSYVWSCEATATEEKRVSLVLPAIGANKKECEVVVKDLPVCKAGACK
jgi:hypothetical protein